MLKKLLEKKAQVPEKSSGSRRKFLTGAAAATGAAIAAFPMIAKAQGVTSMRWQSTWPAKDIFHEYALDFAKKVNDMTGGELRIEVEVTTPAELEEALAAGAEVVLLDNWPLDALRVAVERAHAARVLVEVSGGVTLDTLPAIAACGPDLVSVGALTHSARAVDISLDFV